MTRLRNLSLEMHCPESIGWNRRHRVKRVLGLVATGCLAGTLQPCAGGESVEVARSLSLDSCIRRAIQHNPDLRTEQLNILIGEEEIVSELAAFAWNLEMTSVYEDRDKPQNAREASSNNDLQDRLFREDAWRSRVGLNKRFTSGTSLEVGMRYSRVEDDLTRNPLVSSFSPEHEFFVGVTLTQPLLRGFGRESTLAEVDLARLRAESARLLTMLKAMNLVAEVSARYIDVVAAEENLGVKSQNIDRANLMVDRNKARVESGKGVENEVLTAELAAFQRRDDYLDTAAERVERLNALAALIQLGPDFDGGGSFVPVSGFGGPGDLPGKRALIDEAIQNRIDLNYYAKVIDAARINVLRAKNGAKPQLNMIGSAGLYGLDSSAGRALNGALDDQGQEFTLGLEFRMELGGQSGKSAVEVARLQLEQAEIGYGKARNAITLEVDTAYQRVLNIRQRLETAEKARELARRNLEAEELLLEQSKGDLYRVIERQQLYGDANANAVATSALLGKAMIALRLATGQLFEHYEIDEEWITSVVEASEK